MAMLALYSEVVLENILDILELKLSKGWMIFHR